MPAQVWAWVSSSAANNRPPWLGAGRTPARHAFPSREETPSRQSSPFRRGAQSTPPRSPAAPTPTQRTAGAFHPEAPPALGVQRVPQARPAGVPYASPLRAALLFGQADAELRLQSLRLGGSPRLGLLSSAGFSLICLLHQSDPLSYLHLIPALQNS